jgi:hypothetical protein
MTRPFVAAGTRLCANVDATGGILRVEVLDDQDKPLAVAQTIAGDQPRAVMSWLSGDLASLKGRPIHLRFVLRNARFYSFWLEE